MSVIIRGFRALTAPLIEEAPAMLGSFLAGKCVGRVVPYEIDWKGKPSEQPQDWQKIGYFIIQMGLGTGMLVILPKVTSASTSFLSKRSLRYSPEIALCLTGMVSGVISSVIDIFVKKINGNYTPYPARREIYKERLNTLSSYMRTACMMLRMHQCRMTIESVSTIICTGLVFVYDYNPEKACQYLERTKVILGVFYTRVLKGFLSDIPPPTPTNSINPIQYMRDAEDAKKAGEALTYMRWAPNFPDELNWYNEQNVETQNKYPKWYREFPTSLAGAISSFAAATLKFFKIARRPALLIEAMTFTKQLVEDTGRTLAKQVPENKLDAYEAQWAVSQLASLLAETGNIVTAITSLPFEVPEVIELATTSIKFAAILAKLFQNPTYVQVQALAYAEVGLLDAIKCPMMKKLKETVELARQARAVFRKDAPERAEYIKKVIELNTELSTLVTQVTEELTKFAEQDKVKKDAVEGEQKVEVEESKKPPEKTL